MTVCEDLDRRCGCFARFRELWSTKLHTASLGCCQRGLGARSDHCALFLCQRGKQVQNERINVRAKLSDQERHAVRHEARYEVNVSAEAVQLGNSDGAPLPPCFTKSSG